MKLKHFSKTVIGLVRKANEDYIGSNTNIETNGNGDVFVVCDGVGGHVGGAIASKTAVESILQYFKNDSHPNPVIALEKAISFANAQIYQLSQNDPDLTGMGTTCTVLLQKDNQIYIAHVGDSRIYLNTDGKMYRVTKDHSFVQKLVDAGQLKDSEMETHPRKNELTRALGISEQVEVEVSEKPLLVKNGDKFLMCSDGLCGLVNDPTISYIINKESGPNVVDELISLAENAGGNDNISVDIIDVISSPHLKTIFKDQTNKTDDFSETQTLDVSSMKSDRKLINVLKRSKYYITSSFVLVIILFVYLNQSEETIISKETTTINTKIDKTETDKIETDKIETDKIETDKTETDKKIADKKAERIRVANLKEEEEAKADRIRLANLKEDEAKAEEQRRKKEQKRTEDESVLKKINAKFKKLIDEIILYPNDDTTIQNNLKEIKERIDDKKDIYKIENEIDEIINIWEPRKKKFDSILGIIKSEARKLISAVEKSLTSSNEIETNFIKDELDVLKKLESNSKIENKITKAIENLSVKRKRLTKLLNVMNNDDYVTVYKKFKWDKNECGDGNKSHNLIGDVKMYRYEKKYADLNKKYLEEIDFINILINGGAFTLKTDENLNKIDFTLLKYFDIFNSNGIKWTFKELQLLKKCNKVPLKRTYYKNKYVP